MGAIGEVDLSETVRRGGPNAKGIMSKVERYGWTLADKPGVFLEIDKNELNIDYAYQREAVSTGKIEAIARSWSWVACGCLVVFLRDDQTYWVIDGQHRKLAAQKRSDIRHLPCLVFEGTLRDEAAGFQNVNVNRKMLTMLEKIKSLTITEDQVAAQVTEAVKSIGYRLSSSSGRNTLSCAGVLYKIFRQDAAIAKRSLQLLAQLSDGDQISSKVLRGLFYLELRLRSSEAGQSVFDKHNIEAIERAGLIRIAKSIDTTSAIYGTCTEKSCAKGIADILNKGRSARRIACFEMPE